KQSYQTHGQSSPHKSVGYPDHVRYPAGKQQSDNTGYDGKTEVEREYPSEEFRFNFFLDNGHEGSVEQRHSDSSQRRDQHIQPEQLRTHQSREHIGQTERDMHGIDDDDF